MMKATMNNTTNASADMNVATLRRENLRERNRRVGSVVGLVVVLLMLLSMAYIYWFGGLNKGPMKPLGDLSAPGLSLAWERSTCV
jgi:hypothetical protein